VTDNQRRCFDCYHFVQTPVQNTRYGKCLKGANPALTLAAESASEPVQAMAEFCDYFLYAPYSTHFRAMVGQKLLREPNFSTACMARKFVPYYKSFGSVYLKVEYEYPSGRKDYNTGMVAMTTGWRPVFILLRSTRSRGSSVVLSDNYKIVGIRHRDEKLYKEVNL